jgi:hypothetical protein
VQTQISVKKYLESLQAQVAAKKIGGHFSKRQVISGLAQFAVQEQSSAFSYVTCLTSPGARRTSKVGLAGPLSTKLKINESETLRSRRSRDTGLPLRHDRNLRPGTTAEEFSICLSADRRTAHPDHCGTIGAPQSL